MRGEVLSEIVIVGSGPAGLTAAIYAARAGLSPLVLSGNQPGGQLTTTTLVENWPGYEKGIQGPELMDVMMKQAESFGTQFQHDLVEGLESSSSGSPQLRLKSGKTLSASVVILTTGASPKLPDHLSFGSLMGRGISTCATCDGFFYRDREVAVVGGGDSAAEESLYLSKIVKKVYLIHRRDRLRASQIMSERVQKSEKIEILWETQVQDFLQDGQGIQGVRLRKKDGGEEDLLLSGLFFAIGHIPNVGFLKGSQVCLNEKGYVQTFEGTFTSQKGVFAAGDVEDFLYRQAVTAAGRGCQAALQAERYLSGVLSFAKWL